MEKIQSELLKILYYMDEMECEELTMKTKGREMTVLLTDCEGGDSIESGQECAKSIPTESGAQAGDSIIPALLNLLPPHTVIQWQDKDDIFHTKMVEEIDTYMLEQILGCAYWQYDSREEIMTFTRRLE